MKQWGLAIISIGGVFIISSQLQANSSSLIAVGIFCIVVGTIMFRRGKSNK